MFEQVGVIVRCPNKFPGPPTLAINTVGEGLRKHIHLCYVCRRFSPNRPGHCLIAQSLFDICKVHGVANALVRCAEFDGLPGVEVRESVSPPVDLYKDAISMETVPQVRADDRSESSKSNKRSSL